MGKISIYLLPIIILLLMALAVYYIGRRYAWAFSLHRWWTIIPLVVIVATFLVSAVVIMRTNSTTTMGHLMNNISTIGFGVFAILLCSTLVVDFANIFAKFTPRIFGMIGLGLTTLLSVYSLWNAQNTKVFHVSVDLPNMTQPVRIAQLSDIHIGHFWGKNTMQKLVDLVKVENVDAVVITGDMFDGRVRLEQRVLEPLKELSVPIYFIEGNHDGYSGAKEIKTMLTENGVTVLDNKKIELGELQIVGLDYLIPDKESVDQFHGSLSKTTIKEELPRMAIDTTRPSVLLHHNPVGVDYAAQNGINLYLAGHTHAGQLFPATLIAKMMFPYNKGLYKVNDNTQVYVSQGSGTFGPPMRLGTSSEVTILDLI